MRRYYHSLHSQAEGGLPRAGATIVAGEIERERIPGLIDALDCLLALWIAEATLDSESDTAILAATASY